VVLDQSVVNSKLYKAFKKLDFDISNPRKTVNTLNKYFKKSGVIFDTISSDLMKSNDLIIYGYYCPDKLDDKITIILQYNSNTNLQYDETIIFDISVIIQHELVHEGQEQKRNSWHFRIAPPLPSPIDETGALEMKAYLSHPDEIDAYAFQALLEISYKCLGNHISLNFVKFMLDSSESWGLYQAANVDDHVKRRFLRKLCKWYYQGIHWQES